MNITTMEQFAALPIGAKIADVSSGTERVWDKNADGWLWETTTLQDRFFGPAVLAGQVSTWTPPLPVVGEEYTTPEAGNTVYRVPMAVEGERGNWSADVAVFNRRAVFQRFERRVEFIAGVRRTAGSNLPTATLATTQALYAEAQKVHVFQQALHTYLDEHSYPENSPLEQVMVAHGLEARYADVTVSLAITGWSLTTLGKSTLIETFGPHVTADVSVEVPWQVDRQITVKAPGCGCRKVTRQMVAEAIGFEATRFEYTASCALDPAAAEEEPKPELAEVF